MTALSPVVPGQSEATSNDHAQCARLSAEAAIRTLGHGISLPGILDNSDGNQIAGGITRVGGLAQAVYGVLPSQLMARSIDVGRYLMVLVNCTINAVPVSYNTFPRLHWIVAWSDAGDEYNPWLAHNEKANLDADFYRGGGGSCVIVGWPAPAPQPVPVQTGDDMSGSYVTPGGAQCYWWVDPANGHMWEMWYTGAWNGPVDQTVGAFKGLTAKDGFACSCTPDGSQLIFWRAPDGHRYEAYYVNGWNGPVRLSGT